MAARYWIGGTGTWAATTTNWATTSGGTGGASVPGASDNVIIDNASGSGAFTITRTATAAFQGISITRTSGIVTVVGSSAWAITTAGISIVSGAACAWDNTGTVTITGTCALNLNGNVISSAVTVNGSGITVTLGSNFSSVRAFTLTQGTLALGTFTLTCLQFIGGSTGSRSISFGTGSAINLDNAAAGATIFDTSAAGITLSGTPNITVWWRQVSQTIITGINVFNFAGVSAGTVSSGILTLTGAFGTVALGGSMPDISISAATSIAGPVDFSSIPTLRSTGTLTLNGANQTLTMGGKTCPYAIVIAGTGTFTFADTFVSSSSLTHSGTASVLQGPVSAVNVTAATLTRSGTNTWNTRGGSITTTNGSGTVCAVAATATFTSATSIILGGGANRTVSVISPLVTLTLGTVADTVSFTASSLAAIVTTGFTGTLSGALTLVNAAALDAVTEPALNLTLNPGTGNTISQTVSAIASVTAASGTINLTSTGTIGTITMTAGTLTLSSAGAISMTTLTLNGGTFNLTKNISVTGTLTFASGAMVLNGFTATVGTVNFASTINDINAISAGIVATNLTISGTGEYIFNADAAVAGTILVANGTLKLSGFTATCLTFQQINGTVAFGTGGAVKARQSLTATGGASTGTGSLFLEGAFTDTRTVSGAGFSAGVVIVDAAGSLGVTGNATLTSLTTTALTQPLTGIVALKGVAALGNHDVSGLELIVFSATGASVSTTTFSRGLASLSVSANCTCLLASNLKVAGTTTLSGGSVLTLAGFTLETTTFAGASLNEANRTLAFGSTGTDRLRVTDGRFAAISIPETIDGEGTVVYGTGGTGVTGTGTIELSGAATNVFDVNIGSYAGITLNLASAVPATIATGGAVLGNITNSATGMAVSFRGTGAAASKVNAFNLQQCLIGTAVLGVRQDLVFNAAGTTQIYNNLVTGINASPVSTWFAQGINGCIDGGNNSGIAFGSAYTGPKTDSPVYIGKRRFYT